MGGELLETGRHDGRVYVNYLENEGQARVRAAYGPNYDRLVAIKNSGRPGVDAPPGEESTIA